MDAPVGPACIRHAEQAGCVVCNFEGLVLKGAAINGLTAGACNAEQFSTKSTTEYQDAPSGLMELGTALTVLQTESQR